LLRFASLGHPLPNHVGGHADTNPEGAAYFLWLHSKSLPAG
jgi:hypothetical protein